MNTPESSPLWYRVAGLKARLHDHVRIHRHHYRGQLWYILQGRTSAKHYRFGPEVFRVLRLMNGQRTMQAIWERLRREPGEEAPSQEDIVKLLASLHGGDLIQSDVSPDTRELFNRYEKARGMKWKQYVKGPLLIRIPLSDPDRLLQRMSGWTALLFGPAGLLLWLLVVGTGALLAGAYWSELQNYWGARALAPYNLLLIVLTYPLVKGLHELAHGLAVKRWGGEVHEMGIMLLVFMPLPYVDASAATAFHDKYKRMLVGAAGILTELFLAAAAMFLWFNVETGIVRDLAFDVMLIGGISTLFFNGNPLLRFDGYYVLADAVEIPNLAPRSTQYYGYLAQRYLFGVADARSPVRAPGERRWFLFYGVASYLYRLFILLTIVLFLAEEYLVVGVVLGLTAIGLQVLMPIGRQLKFVFRSPLLRGRRFRAVTLLGGLVGTLLAVTMLVPLPASTYAQGIVWLPRDAQVRALADGFVIRILATPQGGVAPDQPLIESEDPLLELEVQTLGWELRELRARYDRQLLADRAEAGILEGQMQRISADLAQAREQAAELTLYSHASGTFLVSGAHHLPGRFVHKGDVLGYVTDLSRPTVRAVISQDDIALVRERTRAVKLRLADRPGQTIPARIQHQVPSATSQLPSQALGTRGGGLIAVDPGDPEGTTATEEVFLLDIELPRDISLDRVGTRVHLRFEHEAAPLVDTLSRMLRQLFLRRFSV